MLAGAGAQKLHISPDMLAFLASESDPADPTRLFEQYESDWWNGLENTPDLSNASLERAYQFHIDKVFPKLS